MKAEVLNSVEIITKTYRKNSYVTTKCGIVNFQPTKDSQWTLFRDKHIVIRSDVDRQRYHHNSSSEELELAFFPEIKILEKNFLCCFLIPNF